MMNKFRLLLLASSLFVLNGIGHAQTSTMSLNSSNPKIVWEVKPQADLNNMGGEQISTPGFKMPDYVKGVVPGAVFTAYVEAGIVPDPNYADNIYKVDNSVVAVAEMIENNTDKENPVILCDAEMYYWIRQYDPKLVIPVTNKIMDLYQFQSPDKIDLAEEKKSWKNAVSMFMHGVEIDVDIANKIFEDKEIDFVVCNKEYYSDFYLSYLNLSYVDSVDGYELYRCISN